MTALTLSRVGIAVTIVKRSDNSFRTGAALHVEHGLLRRLPGLNDHIHSMNRRGKNKYGVIDVPTLALLPKPASGQHEPLVSGSNATEVVETALPTMATALAASGAGVRSSLCCFRR
jgi:hypothetical protein